MSLKRDHRRTLVIAALFATIGAVGCGSSGTSLHTSSVSTAAPKAEVGTVAGTTKPIPKLPPYHPKINPADFSTKITNPYFPLSPGRTWTYKGMRDGAPRLNQVTVAPGTKTIMGVKTLIVNDLVTSNGALVEKTTDWYAQDKAGNVWYFGENSADYANNVVVSTHGSWEAGVDNALPGIVMQAHPKQGLFYRSEYRPGVAEDVAKIFTTKATQKVPAGTFHNTVGVLDRDPLDLSKIEHKFFASGVGFVWVERHSGGHFERLRLVKSTP